MSERRTTSIETVSEGVRFEDDAPTKLPQSIGRYRVAQLLGKGSFGAVYLSYDEQLERDVAIKVPHAKRLADPGDAELYLREARTVARLDHPHLVTVFDVGSTAELPLFVVSKYIDGSDLAKRLREVRYSAKEAGLLVATLAEALHYAHTQGLVHRDVKPSNILIDKSGKPYLADFGLVLREEDRLDEQVLVGTPAYMSPEQARGEGHRVDGRSDIFSLGVVLYEILIGRRPFQGETKVALLERVVSMDPKPPRQICDSVPKELERICLRALAKRATDRYTTALDFADDLRHFLNTAAQEESDRRILPSSTDSEVIANRAKQPIGGPPPERMPSGSREIRIVPKGLRSFDEHDADFFLELLPGPRDRDGLPDLIRFWKIRIEERSSAGTFAAGLIYGSSGCGKSSFVRAGLLPRLAEHIIPIYVEANPDDTELRLLRGLTESGVVSAEDWSLTKTIMAIRRGNILPRGRKVLIVLDQFEQWLHTRMQPDAELIQALRQCDGEHVQCLVLVRDDFYLAVNRFFQQLEVPIQEGRNYALVDLFDLGHARKLLTAFGRAYGRLPEGRIALTAEQETFIERAVDGLAHDGKVISLRLALFSEMMKGREWTVESLHAMGGTEGVGITFLEETFSSPSAPPTHRLHQEAARAVLQALLPAAGTDIKGQMQSADRLRELSGYADRPDDFRVLLSILENDLRIIAPTEPAERASAVGSSDDSAVGKYYQLTHDFLVPTVREWLRQKQTETPAGRARLLLLERAALWSAKPESKQLPSFAEWVTILRLARSSQWSDSQRRMMRVASRRHLAAILTVLATTAAMLLLGITLRWQWLQHRQQEQADHLVDQLLVAEVTRVGDLVDQLDNLPGDWRGRLEQIAFDEAKPNPERLRAHLALVRDHPESLPFLIQQTLNAEPVEFTVVISVLSLRKLQCRDSFWLVATDVSASADQRFHAAVALAQLDPEDERWSSIAAPTAMALVRADLLRTSEWTRMLKPVRNILVEPLVAEFRSAAPPETRRVIAASILTEYAVDKPDLLARLLQQADTDQFLILFPAIQAHADYCVRVFQNVIASQGREGGNDVRTRTQSRANAAIALFLLNRPESTLAALEQNVDPDLRTALIDKLPAFVGFDVLWSSLNKNENELARQAIVLCTDAYRADNKLSPKQQERLIAQIGELFVEDGSAAVHSAAEWLLRRLGEQKQIDTLNSRLIGTTRLGWRVSRTGHTLARIHGPVRFEIGSPEEEPRRDGGEDRSPRRIEYSYEIGTHEVTVAQFQKLFPPHHYAEDVSPTLDCPINDVTWYDVARYCRRLSEIEEIPEKDMIFPPVDQIRPDRDLVLPEDWLERSSYRWPTEAEWEFACRAGATTKRFFGTMDDALAKYGWWRSNSQERCWPVGTLRPNPFGLFDVLGNVGEWCFDRRLVYAKAEEPSQVRKISPGTHRVYRGSTYQEMAKDLRSAKRDSSDPASGYSQHGFRIARTIRFRSP